jgi:alpha-tubulin suppressor-like RCC1 family protein
MMSISSVPDKAFACANEACTPFPRTPGLLSSARLLDSNAVIDEDGHLWIWGYFGILNWKTAGDGGPGGGPNGAPSSPVYLADRAIYNPPTRFKALNNVVDIAASAYTIAALDNTGNLWAWGDSNDWVIGKDITGHAAPEKVPDGANQYDLSISTWQPIAQKVTDVAAAEYAYAWVTEDGRVWTSGHNSFAQRGLGTVGSIIRNQTPIPDASWPVLPVSSGGTGKTPRIIAVYNGYEGFMAQDDRGNIYGWGRSFESGMGTSGYFLNGCKQDARKLGEYNHTRNSENFAYDPATCPAAGVVRTPSGSGNYAGVIANDWYITKPVFIPEVTSLGKAHGGIKEIILGYQHGVALTEDGSVLLWGSDEENRNGANRTDTGAHSIEGLRPYVLCLDADGRQPLTPGKAGDDRRPVGAGCTPVKATSIASGQFAASLVTEDGKVIAWGSFLLGGAFGTTAQTRGPALHLDEGVFQRDGYRNNRSLMHVVWDPALDSKSRKARAVGANKDSSLMILDDGSLWVWGENGGGGACGGHGYSSCMPGYWGKGTYGAAFPDAAYQSKGPDGMGYYMHNSLTGLYIWPPLPVDNLQDIAVRIK